MQVLEFPGELRITLTYLRILHGWNQADLAARAGINKSLISLYEGGKQTPSERTFKRLLDAFHLPPKMFDTVLDFVRLLRQMLKGTDEELSQFVTMMAQVMATTVNITVSQKLAGMLTADMKRLPEELEADPLDLAERFLGCPPEVQATLSRDLREFHTWGVCESLCEKSEKLAAESPDGALVLVELAMEISQRVPEGDSRRRRLQGYVWAHLGRARRAVGDLEGAEEAFTRARELWEGADPDDSDVGLADRFLELFAN